MMDREDVHRFLIALGILGVGVGIFLTIALRAAGS